QLRRPKRTAEAANDLRRQCLPKTSRHSKMLWRRSSSRLKLNSGRSTNSARNSARRMRIGATPNREPLKLKAACRPSNPKTSSNSRNKSAAAAGATNEAKQSQLQADLADVKTTLTNTAVTTQEEQKRVSALEALL